MVCYMTEKTGLVHQMPFTCDRNGFAATLEKVNYHKFSIYFWWWHILQTKSCVFNMVLNFFQIYFGTAQSRIYLVADLFRINCHTGMSTLLRKSVLKENGGLKMFGCYLAEDFFICKYFLDKGWRTTISSQPAMQNSGLCDVNSFQARLTRWETIFDNDFTTILTNYVLFILILILNCFQMGQTSCSYGTFGYNFRTVIWMYGYWSLCSLGIFCLIPMGLSGILFNTRFIMVHMRLDLIIYSAGLC